MVEDSDYVALNITDLNMPGLDGVEFAEWVRVYHPGIAVVFVSGRPDLLAPLAVTWRCLVKPFSVSGLTEAVSDLLYSP